MNEDGCHMFLFHGCVVNIWLSLADLWLSLGRVWLIK